MMKKWKWKRKINVEDGHLANDVKNDDGVVIKN